MGKVVSSVLPTMVGLRRLLITQRIEVFTMKYVFLIFLLLGACSTMPKQQQQLQLADKTCGSTQQTERIGTGSMRCEATEFQLASYTIQQQVPRSHLSKNLYMGAGLAALNNPESPAGDVDNISVAVGGKFSIKNLSFRPEIQMGERSNSFNNSVTRDFSILGSGLGSIEGNIGLGYSVNSGDENNVLGNADSAFLRIGAEGYLAGDIMTGVALMVAPSGYNGEDAAIAGMGYFGFRF